MKYIEDEEGFRKPVEKKKRGEEFPDDIIDCWEHMEELKTVEVKSKVGKKKLRYYRRKMDIYAR